MEIRELKEIKVNTIRMKKRQVPLFKVSVDEHSDYTFLSKIPHVEEAVMNELILAIKEGVQKQKKSVSIFNISNTSYSLELERSNWKQSLSKAIKYHENKEDYEKCAECRDLINKLN